jgi:acyl-[acyl-carrier-protein]-phospholipid O-acyltransferase/long-chain-fatty-acid--[acyl-carrier-protein] ligase
MQLPPLLKTSRFLPLFITQFLGAFNDNLFKNAFLALITYRLAADNMETGQLHTILSGAIFILPYFLFSATAGQLADKYDKSTLARLTKIWEIIILGIASLGFYLGNAWFLQLVLFCLGTQATFFGPIKYALLPQHLRDEELISGNAYIEAGTFLAILIGTIAGEMLILTDGGIAIVSALMLICAVSGFFSSMYIPSAPAPVPNLVIGHNLWRETWRIVNASRKKSVVFLSILGSSWFWFVGATFLAQFFPYAKNVIGADTSVVTLFLAMFSVGIGLGSFLCNRLLNGQVQATYVPPAALGITLFTLDFYFASHHAPHTTTDVLMTAGQFLKYPASWRILFDLLMIAISSGIYIVPLYALMQERSDPAERARVIASNNIMNALFMVGSALFTIVLIKLHFSIPGIFLFVAVLNGFVAIYICKLLPDALLRALMQFLFRRLYSVEVKGLENFASAGDRLLIVANHTSFLDAALIASFLPEKITFAINTHVARSWWM